MSLPQVLTKALEASRISSTRPPSLPSAEEHAAIINQLDVNRLSLCKAINECESLLAGKEAELANLKEDTRALEDCDPAAEHANELDSAAYDSWLFCSCCPTCRPHAHHPVFACSYIRDWALSQYSTMTNSLPKCSSVSDTPF
jgi:hypothetical protein